MNGNDRAAGPHPPSSSPEWDAARRQLGNGRLSVMMPAKDLGRAIAANVREVADAFRGQFDFELVVIDDGSSDATRAELERVAGELPSVRPVYLARNVGKGGALKQGFKAATGEFVLFLDADLDLPPRQTARLFDTLERNRADAVIGSKRHPESRLHYPWYRRAASGVYYALVKLLVGLPVHDTQTGIKLFRREVLEWTFPRMLVKRFAFDLELLAIAHQKGFKIAEAPVTLDFRGTIGCFSPGTVRQIMNDTLAIFYRLRILRYYQTIRDLQPPDPPPLVSIVVALPAPSRYLDECLAGIARQTYRRFETILLPDEPSGRSWPDGVREVPTGKLRPAEKRNIGIEQAQGEITAFIDDDACPSESWLEQAVVYFSEPEVAAVGGPAATPAGEAFMARLSGFVYANRLVSGQYVYRYVPERVRDVDDFPSVNLLVRTDVLRELGGFNTEFWPGEDTFLCMDIVRKLGRRIVYDPRVHVTHHRRKLFLPHLRQVGRYALHRGHFARRFPATSRRIAYMVPSLFVIGLAAGGAAAAMLPWLRPFYLAALAFYAAVTLLSAFRLNLWTWFLVWLGVMLTHVVYGARFLQGLLTPRMPGEVYRFDHPSETG